MHICPHFQSNLIERTKMTCYVVLQTPFGFYIFSDPKMRLFDETAFENPEVLKNQLLLKESFLFPNIEFSAYITDSIEHKYLLPPEFTTFFEQFTTKNIASIKSATWYFISNILSQLISESYSLQCFTLPPAVQRNVFQFLPELTNVSAEEMDQARRDLSLCLSQALYSEPIDQDDELES